MPIKTTRLRKAEKKYCEDLHEWLTNPKNEDLPNGIVEAKLDTAFNVFLEELILDEQECADFISVGHVLDEIEFLPLIFEHFKSEMIYKAIKSNCEVAFSGKYSIESDELKDIRKALILHMQNTLGITE